MSERKEEEDEHAYEKKEKRDRGGRTQMTSKGRLFIKSSRHKKHENVAFLALLTLI